MSIVKSVTFDEICQHGCIRDADVQKLRRLFYEDGPILDKEVASLFEINAACRVQDPSWAGFFVEAVTDYIVSDADPDGYLTKDNANWLINCVSRDGVIETQTELEMLLGIMDRARWLPERLIAFALEQVKYAVIGGNGPLRLKGNVSAGVVTDNDVDVLRRALYAFASDGNIAITRREAEILLDINDATAESDNSTAWNELFVKAIASNMMATSGYSVPPRSEALRREQWLESRGDLNLSSMISSAFHGGFGGFLGIYHEQTAEEHALARLEQQRLEIITNEKIKVGRADWLAERIGRDGKLTPNEISLLKCIKQANQTVDSKLTPLLDKIDIAA